MSQNFIHTEVLPRAEAMELIGELMDIGVAFAVAYDLPRSAWGVSYSTKAVGAAKAATPAA